MTNNITQLLWQQAQAALKRFDEVTEVDWHRDEAGNPPTVIRIDLASGSHILVAEDEGGYTYTAYDSNGEDFATDGGENVATFIKDLRSLAQGTGPRFTYTQPTN